jgi:hypothetical protein
MIYTTKPFYTIEFALYFYKYCPICLALRNFALPERFRCSLLDWLSLALKWFCPGTLCTNFPVDVFLSLLVNDLFVFGMVIYPL